MKPNEGAVPSPLGKQARRAHAIPQEAERLRSVVADRECSDGSLQTALQSARSARAKQSVELRATLNSHRSTVNIREDAFLVLMHMLD